MGWISVENLEPGMVLASDLFTDRGQFVLAKGASLTGQHLHALQSWGVEEADIDGVDESTGLDPETEESLLAQARIVQTERFALNDPHQLVVADLQKLAEHWMLKRLAKGWKPSMPVVFTPNRAVPSGPFQTVSVTDLVRSNIKLASLPEVYRNIVEALADPASSADHLAKLVSKDSSLSLRLLRLVNSALYGLTTRTDSIARAITLVGTKELISLAQGLAVIRLFDSVPSDLIDMDLFWRHSVRTALTAQMLAQQSKLVHPEQAFLGGLLHDIGRLVLLLELPDHYQVICRRAAEEDLPLFRAERVELKYDHGRVGGLLCEKWLLPRPIGKMTAWHHKPEGDRYSVESSLIHVADFLAHACGAEDSLVRRLPPLSAKACEMIRLDSTLLPATLSRIENRFKDVVGAFLSNPLKSS